MNKTILFSNHEKLKAKMVPFSGFKMPVWYVGLKEEHQAVRETCGMFDISHMGCFEITGDNSQSFLQQISCNDLDKTKKNNMVYSMALNENGGILDDIMIGKLPHSFYLVVNAGNKEKMVNWMNSLERDGISITDLNKTNGFIAIQGPDAAEKLSTIFGIDFKAIGRFTVENKILDGVTVIASRTGYTGEDGFELLVPNDSISQIWEKIIESGVQPCGLGARDTLRIEAGLPLYGQELSETITPLETRYKWVVKLEKNFTGRDALANLSNTTTRTTIGFEMEDRMIPRPHYKIKGGGEVTSGTLSPTLGKPIGMAIISKELAETGEFEIDIRGKFYKANVTSVPFVKK